MSQGRNLVILLGNLGSDPEVRATGAGVPVANFRLATGEKYTTQEGERKERTEWHRIVCFGRNAELAEEFLQKGSQVEIQGKLQTRTYTAKDGVERKNTEIVVENMTFLKNCHPQLEE